MKKFLNVTDLGDLNAALKEALEIKADRFKYDTLGKNKTLLMVFFNNSLRTRLSTQKAAMNLGMNVIVLDVNAGAWKLETEHGVIMNGDKSEHLLEAIPVMASFCDIIGIRSFAGLQDREYDYAETVYNQFVQYSGKPVFAMETATVHPLQAFADLITIEEHKTVKRPKVVLTWAPHCRCLPQAVPNSFAEWMNAADVDFVITHPKGYDLDPAFVGDAKVEYDQKKAFEGADFIYAKNWSCPGVGNPADYGKNILPFGEAEANSWTVDEEHMSWTNNGKFMHCLPVRRGLIVSDVMMPGIDGYELCRRVKSEIKTSHIPVILLTARTTDESKLQGLELGADDYVTKPFNMDVLLLRVQKLMEWSQKSHQQFRQKVDVSPSEITITPLDEKFVKSALKIVEDNIANSDFTVEMLAQQIGMSRSALYKKIMAVTGLGPAEFIRTVRIKRGKALLKRSQMQITEIAYSVGFNFLKSFTMNFKAEYGLTPSEYLKKKGFK